MALRTDAPRNRSVTSDAAFSDQYRDWFRMMLLTVALRSGRAEAYSVGQIGGFCHLYIGKRQLRSAPSRRSGLMTRRRPIANMPGPRTRHDVGGAYG